MLSDGCVRRTSPGPVGRGGAERGRFKTTQSQPDTSGDSGGCLSQDSPTPRPMSCCSAFQSTNEETARPLKVQALPERLPSAVANWSPAQPRFTMEGRQKSIHTGRLSLNKFPLTLSNLNTNPASIEGDKTVPVTSSKVCLS